jgi:predicted dehydrogenase
MMKIEKPEIVSVCTPDATHVEIASLVLNSPGVCAVLLEKPLAPTVCEAEKILTLARQRGVVLAVNYSRRYAEGHVRLQKFVREGGIGEIVTIGGIYTKGTLHNGTHWFDAVRWLAGEITRVRGFDLRREPGNDPTLDAILEFENGASAHLQAADATVATVFEMDLVGTRGRVRIVHSGLNIEVFHVADSDQFAGHRVMVPGESFPSGGDWLLHAVSDLVSCLEEDRAPRCSGENALAALRIALAVRKSAATGCPVKPTEIA